jgi:hypothetical protein
VGFKGLHLKCLIVLSLVSCSLILFSSSGPYGGSGGGGGGGDDDDDDDKGNVM